MSKQYIKPIWTYMAIALIFSIFIPVFLGSQQNIYASESTAIDYISKNWLNYTNDTGKWHVSTVNGKPAIGSTFNADDWTGYLNDSRAGQTTIDAEFEFYMIQKEAAGHFIDDDNMGWTFRHTYTGDYTNIDNHSYYAFVTVGSPNGWLYESGLYKRTGSNFTKIAPINFYRSQGVPYHVKISVKDESNGARIKIYVDNNLICDYLDKNPLPMGGYGPFSKSQAYAYFYDIKVNGASFLNIPPSITVTSPANGGIHRHGDKIAINGTMHDIDARGTLSAYYSINGGSDVLIKTVNSTGQPQSFNTTYTIPANLPDGTHTMRIYVKDNENGQSEIVTRTFSVYTKPKQPLSKGYDNITENSVRMLWDANGNPSTMGYHYEVRRKSDDSLFTQGTVNGTSVTVTGLSGGHDKYRFFVRAINGNNETTGFTELIIPSLEVYQKSNYVKAEWGIEMLEEDVLIDASFEDGETYIPSFQTRFPVFAEEGISFKDSQDNRYLQSTIRAKGWITKQDFDSGNYTRATTFEFNEKYSTYYKMSDGRYRLEHNLYVNGQQEFTNEESYTGNKSYKIGRTLDKMGNNYYDLNTSANSSVGKFPHTTAIANGVDLSLTFRAKTDNKTTITPQMHGGMATWTYPFHERYGLKKPLVVNKAAKIGERVIYIDGIEQLNTNGIYYVCRKQAKTVERTHNYARVLEINKEEGYIVLQSGITEDFPVGYVLHAHVNRTPVSFGGRTIYAKDGWQLFSINAKVTDYPDYKSDLLGLGLWFIVTSEGNTYIDDVKLGFATMSALYRDGEKVYEGYLSDYDDYEAIDKANPDSVSSIEVRNTGDEINIVFEEPTDYGTTYTYQVEAVRHNGLNIGSEIKSVTVTSGIKGYSYVIDSKTNTIPDDIVDVTKPEINHKIDPHKKNYIHIKVIDNQGNTSAVYHQEINIPFLTATPVPEGDYIHLDWTMNDTSKHYLYMVYKKAEGDSEYQSIPIKDRIKVLEVYPYVSVLKDWTDAYGMGKITTHSISSEALNNNPQQIWDYDVVVLGFADSNNKKTLTDNARIELEKFVEQGRGLLLGHDTVYPDANRTNYVQLAEKYLNMDAYNKGNWYNGVPDRNDSGAGGTSTIVITRKGFLTNYPHKIGDVGTKLVVPYSHTSYQFAKGDIWMRYDDDNMTDPYNFYLTTWNNVAMAQTGHSIRKDNDTEEWATPDEQKLIVNTLFYLAQISDVTEWDDHTGQDVAGPTKPEILEVNLLNNANTVGIKYSASQDRGSKYYYYVEGMAENTLVRSNVADATITTGLKGYSIVVDENPDTVPDNIIETTGLEYKIHETFNREFFVHVAAVDNVGNISEVAHYRFTDDKAPSLIVTGNPTEWTKEDVVLKATAYDEDSGVKRIQLPDGSYVYSDVATFTVTQNGTYMFTAEDNFGNKTTVTVVVNRIDKTGPSASLIINNDDLYTNKCNVTLTIHATDNATGVSLMRFRPNDGSWTGWIPYATTHSFTLEDKQGTNYVYGQFQDGIGNTSDTVYDTIIYDSVPPEGAIKYHRSVINSRNVNLTIDAYDVNPYQADKISGVDAVRFRELADGAVVKDWTSWESYQPARNWLFSEGDGEKTIEMEIRDKAGNIGRVSKTFYLDTLFIDKAEFIDIVNPPLGNPPLPTSDIVKIKKGYDFTFVVQTTGDPDEATYSFHGQLGTMRRLSENLFIQTLRLDVHDDTAAGLIPIYITVTRNSDGAQKSTTLKVHVGGSAYNDYDINLTN